jgi:hypothetical protein
MSQFPVDDVELAKAIEAARELDVEGMDERESFSLNFVWDREVGRWKQTE